LDFNANYSITHALVSCTKKFRNSLDNCKFGFGIFPDLQKALDTVIHEILLIGMLIEMLHHASYCLIYSWFWFDRVRRGAVVVVLPKKNSSTFKGNDTITQNRFDRCAFRRFAVLSHSHVSTKMLCYIMQSTKMIAWILEATWMVLVSSGIKPQLTCSYISVRQTSQMQQILSLLHQVSKIKKRSHLQK